MVQLNLAVLTVLGLLVLPNNFVSTSKIGNFLNPAPASTKSTPGNQISLNHPTPGATSRDTAARPIPRNGRSIGEIWKENEANE